MNIIQTLEREEIARVGNGKAKPDFAPGDTLKVHVKVTEGNRQRASRLAQGLRLVPAGVFALWL